MYKVLFLPLFQLPTGHHRVADALMNALATHLPAVHTKKIDFLSYVGPNLEKLVTTLYMKWINRAPESYDRVYRKVMYPMSSQHYFQLYEELFLKKMSKLLQEEKPDLVVCTQSFPSFLISRLKQSHGLRVPVVNVYTDFFINNLWGRKGIDYHFVPDIPFKQDLIRHAGISPSQVFVTGIPVDEAYTMQSKRRHVPHVLIAGGSNGLGDIAKLLRLISPDSPLMFSVLCGTHQALYEEITAWNHPRIKAIGYITSPAQMNELYDSAAAIITKPGGVTVSEALIKRVPVFIHSELPGQEIINRQYLINHQLAFTLNWKRPLEQQVLNILEDTRAMTNWENAVDSYLQRLEGKAWEHIAALIKGMPPTLTDPLPVQFLTGCWR